MMDAGREAVRHR